MRKRVLILCIVFGIVCVSGVSSDPYKFNKDFRTDFLLKKVIEFDNIKVVRAEKSTEGWVWIELKLFDEKYPLTIDLVAGTRPGHMNGKIMYLVAPSGLNFKSMFMAPSDRSLAKFMLKNGYIVVGVTFREDSVPVSETGAFLAEWGLGKHTADLAKVVGLIESILPLRYEMLGQASSSVTIMDFASKTRGGLEKIILLDTDSFDPAIYPQKIEYARMTHDALDRIMSDGTYHEQFTSSIRDLTIAGTLYPDIDSGVARSFLGLPGNFTFGGLLHFSLEFTASLPGIHTPITGLPGEWVMKKGVAAGYYNFSPDPLTDDFALTRTDLADLLEGVSQIGDGISPIALNRDVYGILSLSGNAYPIDWRGIREKVVMVNGEYSSGDQVYYGSLIKQNGNHNVTINVVADYAYLDLLFGTEADTTVWPLFLK